MLASKKNLMQQYQYAADLKQETNKLLHDYNEKTETLRTSLFDHFQLLPNQRELSTASVDLSQPLKQQLHQQFEKALLPLFNEYHASLQKILDTWPSSTARDKQILNNLRISLHQSEANLTLSQKMAKYAVVPASVNKTVP